MHGRDATITPRGSREHLGGKYFSSEGLGEVEPPPTQRNLRHWVERG